MRQVRAVLPVPAQPSGLAVLAAGGAAGLDRAHLEPVLVDLAASWWPPSRALTASVRADGSRAVRRVLDWLEQQPGQDWAQRWRASGIEQAGRGWPQLTGLEGPSARAAAHYAITALIVVKAVQPGSGWLLGTKRIRLWLDWTRYHDQDLYAELAALLAASTSCPRTLDTVPKDLVRLSITTGRPLAALTRADFLAEHALLISVDRRSRSLHPAWHYLHRLGLLAGEPEDLHQVLAGRQRTPAELVDQYDVRTPAMRDLLVDYLTERSVACDYSTLTTIALHLVKLFWVDLERHYPGLDALALTNEQANGWRERVQTQPSGRPRKNWPDVVSAVRTFYGDLAGWAHEDPARWAPWVAPCPFRQQEVRRAHAARSRQLAEVQARTRALLPVLPQLVASVNRELRLAERRLAAAAATGYGQTFTLDGQRWQVAPIAEDRLHYPRSVVVAIDPDGRRVNLTAAEDRAFWTWAAMEVLRHTGVRIEEMLELTHLSIRPFRKPTGEVIPLLQVAPSKTDTERVLPASPELAHALSRIVARQLAAAGIQALPHQPDKGAGEARPATAVPLTVRRDEHERSHSAPLPFLFARRLVNGRRAVFSSATIRSYLEAAATAAGLVDNDGTALRITPHDFRRLFLTDLVGSGFPIHIAAQLAGHEDLNTTRRYTAIYPQEVFEHYQRFLAHRRAERPAEEYRTPTADELTAFGEHFGRRRVELGDCVRPYGSGCSHEHACIRCDFLQVQPVAAEQLRSIEADLTGRIANAREQTWLGDVEQLQVTLDRLHDKQTRLDDLLATLPSPPLALAQPALVAP